MRRESDHDRPFEPKRSTDQPQRVPSRQWRPGADSALVGIIAGSGRESGKRVTTTAAAKPPVRFACIYFSNGVEPAYWWAKGAGAAMEIGPGLKPMMPFREDMVFVKGLFNEQAARHRSPHLGRIPNLLSGAWVSTDQQEIRVGKTMDQVLAEHLGKQDGRTQPRPRHRTDRAAARRRPVDDLRLVYFVGERHETGDQGNLPVTRLRPAHRRRRRPASSIARFSIKCLPTHTTSSGRSVSTTARSWTNTSNRSVISRSASNARQTTAGWKAGGRRQRPPKHAASRRPVAVRYSGPHAVDDGFDRARVSDGQDADRHLHAQQRPVANEFRVP